MPIPSKTPVETRDEYIARCMKELESEFPDPKQRAAVCYLQLKK